MEGAGSARVLGVVLAGGRSERMGECKALLPWPGPPGEGPAPMLLHAARALARVTERVSVAPGAQAAVAEAAAAAGLDVLADAGEPRAGEVSVGPLGAIAAGLEVALARRLDGVLALACDMPRVGAGELEPLLGALAGGADAAMWCLDGRDQPLCAAYGLACLEPAQEALARGERRVVAPLDPPATGGRGPVVARLVPDAKSALRLLNVNTPADYDLGRKGLA